MREEALLRFDELILAQDPFAFLVCLSDVTEVVENGDIMDEVDVIVLFEPLVPVTDFLVVELLNLVVAQELHVCDFFGGVLLHAIALGVGAFDLVLAQKDCIHYDQLVAS